jgi:hypothetical protein
MASKNPKAPAPGRVTTKATRPAAPRRRTPAATPAPLAAGADAVNGAEDEPAEPYVDSAEQIRTRAYFLHLERQGRPGNPVEDWLAAERELNRASE